MTRKPRTSKNATPARAPRKAPTTLRIKNSTWASVGNFLVSRSRDIALLVIVAGAFVAVYDGSLYSATAFGFHGKSAIAFALMPDALMVLATAKQRQVGIHPAQWRTAHRWTQIALAFSLLTNMIAAFLRSCPAEWITWQVLLAGGVIYHGMVVVFLKGAFDVLTKVRADRKAKAPKGSVVVTEMSAPLSGELVVNTRTASLADTVLANLTALVKPVGRKA